MSTRSVVAVTLIASISRIACFSAVLASSSATGQPKPAREGQPGKEAGMDPRMRGYLRATPVIDCDHPSIRQQAEALAGGQTDPVEASRRLFYFVRDAVEYRFYPPRLPPEVFFRASNTLAVRTGFCVPKAVLLAALSRAVGIPSALGFADIRNHRLPESAARLLGGNVPIMHGYTELYLEGRWLKVTPAFDSTMCKEHRLIPVEFDGRNDAMFASSDRDGHRHIEYLRIRCEHRADIDPQMLIEEMMRGAGTAG